MYRVISISVGELRENIQDSKSHQRFFFNHPPEIQLFTIVFGTHFELQLPPFLGDIIMIAPLERY